MNRDLALWRLQSQQILQPTLRQPGEVVAIPAIKKLSVLLSPAHLRYRVSGQTAPSRGSPAGPG